MENDQFKQQLGKEKGSVLDGQCNCNENIQMMYGDYAVIILIITVAILNVCMSTIGYFTYAVKSTEEYKPN